MYVITKINRYYKGGARVTAEKFLKTTESLDEIIALARKQERYDGEADEAIEELKDMGITAFKGYMIEER